MTRALSRCDLAAVRVGKDLDETLLHVASYCGHVGMVMLLLGCVVDKDNAENTDGVTPLYSACQEGHLDIVQFLIDAGADKDKAPSNDMMSPSYIAARKMPGPNGPTSQFRGV